MRYRGFGKTRQHRDRINPHSLRRDFGSGTCARHAAGSESGLHHRIRNPVHCTENEKKNEERSVLPRNQTQTHTASQAMRRCFTLCVCVCVCVFGDSLCAPICASTHSISHSGSQSQQQQQQHTLRVHVCMCLLLLLGGPKRGGPFLVTSGRTWDMKKNSWAPKLFYDNIPAHGGSTSQSAVWHDDACLGAKPNKAG
jgi:hypothetical protein